MIQVKSELAAETEHSKSLQVKLKAMSSTSIVASKFTGGSASERIAQELASVKQRMNLTEDFTGLQVTSSLDAPEGAQFTCVLSDLLGETGCTLLYSFSGK